MSITAKEVEKVAHLARLQINGEEMPLHIHNLSNILNLIAQMDQVDTSQISPMAHPLNLTQYQRLDAVTETNQRTLFQSIAPAVESGLYLVPQVIE
jgi:aspartyl-tRNA(Asn)/glutamyl-tRNA(Gln) amidotransferase subunit C